MSGSRGTVLVTGATGLIGKQTLMPLVERGFAVHAVARRVPNLRRRGTTWQMADLLDPAARAAVIDVAKPTHLLHLAWVTEHGAFWEDPLNDAWLDASQDLVQRFVAAGGERVVVAGTCAEYDWADPSLRKGRCVELTTPCAPTTRYGRAKLALGRSVSDLTRSAATGRVFLVFGDGEAPARLVPSLIDNLLKGTPVALGPGELERDFLDAKTIGAAFAALLASEVTGPVNVASGKPRSIEDVATMVGSILGRPDLIQLGARPPRPEDPPRLVADVNRLMGEVGFDPAFDLRGSLTAFIERRRLALGVQ
jgi:nucleoside-diphosphate-sugar epimerase